MKQTLVQAIHLALTEKSVSLARAAYALDGCAPSNGNGNEAYRAMVGDLPPRRNRSYTAGQWIDAVYAVTGARRYRTRSHADAMTAAAQVEADAAMPDVRFAIPTTYARCDHGHSYDTDDGQIETEHLREVCVEADGSVLAWDTEGEYYTRHHDLTDGEVETAQGLARQVRAGTHVITAGRVYRAHRRIYEYLAEHGAMSGRDICDDLRVDEAEVDMAAQSGVINRCTPPAGGVSPWFQAAN